ncbi:hypothetical protein V7S43_002202 [Phytophthora oleae]|uniref:Telomerase Cajal body protein 1 n=1 Tax=Phytophthora oleae TaxID=2107226 RepID=A0ABD3G2V6_9STRA
MDTSVDTVLAQPQPFIHNAAMRRQLQFSASKEFSDSSPACSNNFTKGVKVSPDGLCMLTNSDDHVLRLFEMSNETNASSILQAKEGSTVYDYEWYPFMTSADPNSCIFVSTSRDQPVHLWDAYTGELRASYRAFDHMDELASAHSLAFNSTGTKLYAGFDRMIRFFDLSRPSRDFKARPLSKTRRSRQGQRGLVSTLHFNPDHSKIYAAGSYAGTTCVYTEDEGEELLTLRDHDGRGISQVRFSPCGRFLFTAARHDARIHCWDIRATNEILHTFNRVADMNLRVEFDLHCGGRYLATGSRTGRVMLYDVLTGALLDEGIRLPDCANGVSFFPDPTRALLAVSSGQRHYDLPEDMQEEDELVANGNDAAQTRNLLQVYEFQMPQNDEVNGKHNATSET